MSKFLTPPVWYDGRGNLVEILKEISVSDSVAMGEGANASNESVAIGAGCQSGGGGVAIGFNAIASNNSVVVGRSSSSGHQGDIILGNNSLTTGTDQNLAGNIIIGNNIRLENTYNAIQIGSSNVTCSAQIGDGNSTLKCICSTAQQAQQAQQAQTTGFTHTSWIQSQQGDIYPLAYLAPDIAATYQIALFDSADFKNCITSGIFYFEGSKAGSTHVFAQTLDVDMNYNSSTATTFAQRARKIYIFPPTPFDEDKRWTMYAAEYYGDGGLRHKYLAFKYRRIE